MGNEITRQQRKVQRQAKKSQRKAKKKLRGKGFGSKKEKDTCEWTKGKNKSGWVCTKKKKGDRPKKKTDPKPKNKKVAIQPSYKPKDPFGNYIEG